MVLLMTDLNLPYGQSHIQLELDESRPVEIVSPKRIPADDDAIAKSLTKPIAFTDLPSFLLKRDKILVVVNDHTRPTPTRDVLKSLNLDGKDVTTIVATGAHRSPYQNELPRILGGPLPPYGGNVVTHDSRNMQCLNSIGCTSRGTKVFVNRHIAAADGIIVVGSVEPHYLAGFTGGRKFLLPALAGLESIMANHMLALDERSRILSLNGNPVHEDMMEALTLLGRDEDIFSIQLVTNFDHQVSFARSGQIVNSFTEAVDDARGIFAMPVQAKADIVISIAKPPMDVDLYQSQKAIDNVKLALNDGGVLVLVSRCSDGIGDRGFYDILARDKTKGKVENQSFGYHKAVKMAEVLKRVHVFAVTGLPPDVLRAISIRPFMNLDSALEEATKIKGKGSRVLIVLDGSVTVPLPQR
jgi:nickel-dependent lactate racemase